MQHSKLMNRLEEIRDAEEGVRVAQAHLAYWQVQASEREIERRVAAQMAIIAEAQREIERARHDHAAAPARIRQCETRLVECRQRLQELKSDRKLQKLLKLYEQLLDEHKCADYAQPFVYPNGVAGEGSVCSLCGQTV